MAASDVCCVCLHAVDNSSYLLKGDAIHTFLRIANININDLKDFPCQLCWQCYAMFRRCVLFQNLCHQNMNLLKEYISSNSHLKLVDIPELHLKRKLCYPFLSSCKTSQFDYQPENDDFIDKFSIHAISNLVLFNESNNADEIKNELNTNNSDDVTLTNDIICVKTELDDDHFCDSDNEPVIKKVKNKMKTNKKSRKLEKTCSKNNILNTPSKNFDFSMVTVSTLSREEQIQELEDLRNTDEYIRAPYKCIMCARGFAHEIVYKEHCIKHEIVSGQYICELCTQHFNTRRNLSNHLDTHASRYTCRLCNKVVISKQNIMSHMYTEHDQTNKQIKCEICQKIYKNRYTYAKHMRIHNSSKEYKCHLCPKVFLWKDNLNRHLTRHKSEKPFKCNSCMKSFSLKENLKDHQLIHLGAKRFYCAECDLSYASQVKLNQHLKRGTRHLKPEQLTFPCKLCDMRYTNSLQLSMHNDRVHLNKRSQACQLCDAAFVSKKTLQIHVRAVHEGYRKPRDHICETCGKGFCDKQVLKAHIRTHTGEKPYSCKYCDAKFAHSGAMYTHVKLVHFKMKKNTKKRNNGNDKIKSDFPIDENDKNSIIIENKPMIPS